MSLRNRNVRTALLLLLLVLIFFGTVIAKYWLIGGK